MDSLYGGADEPANSLEPLPYHVTRARIVELVCGTGSTAVLANGEPSRGSTVRFQGERRR